MAKTKMVAASVKLVRVPPLTRLQLDHALHRLDQAARDRAQREMANLGGEPKNVKLSEDEKMAQIRSGKAKLTAREINVYARLEDAFEFVQTAEQVKAAAAVKAHADAYAKCRERLDREKQSVVDQLIMTNDGARALELIAQFAAARSES
jgi:hypothetical protein